jgi:hypothetical protein
VKYIKKFENVGTLDFDDLSKAGRYIELELDLKQNIDGYVNFYWDYVSRTKSLSDAELGYVGNQIFFSSPQLLNSQSEFGYYFIFKDDANTRKIIDFCKKNNIKYFTTKSESFLDCVEYVCKLKKYIVLEYSQLYNNIKNYNL